MAAGRLCQRNGSDPENGDGQRPRVLAVHRTSRKMRFQRGVKDPEGGERMERSQE